MEYYVDCLFIKWIIKKHMLKLNKNVLIGSERRSANSTSTHFDESRCINKSLSMLNEV
jgi:hypothetical protein